MASLRKRGRVWYYRFVDENGAQKNIKGCSDRRETERMAVVAETEAAKIRAGLADRGELARREHAGRPIAEHIEAWGAALEAKGSTPKHVALSVGRVRRLVAVVRGASMTEVNPPRNATRSDLARFESVLCDWLKPARLADLTADKVQAALRSLITQGVGLATVNHYKRAVGSFSRWCWKSGRLAADPLIGLTTYNAAEDVRHDRRAIGLDELRRLVEAASEGPSRMGVPGPVRALVYRLAVATGLRYSEIQSIAPGSFDWRSEPPTVTVEAGYTKNGDVATLPLPGDLVNDLRPYVAPLPFGEPVFDLPPGKGAKLLRFDLKAAGVPYRDASGRYFDFHCLRGMLATLADASGASPRVVQKLMRHSTLELTGKYTRPRVVDLNAAALAVPSLKPHSDRPNASTLAATGTDRACNPTLAGSDACTVEQPISNRRGLHLAYTGDVSGRDLSHSDVTTDSDAQPSINEKPRGRRGLSHPDGSGRGKREARPVGFEPTTFGFEVRDSIR